jgi:hypothetical protein
MPGGWTIDEGGERMRPGASGAMTMRHVGLVALEALLVAVLVWVAAMTLAGATQNGGIVGAAEAGQDPASLTTGDARLGGTVVFTAHPGDAGMWVHATCAQSAANVLNQWVRVDATHRASLSLAPSALWSPGAAACTAEEGYFSSNGRWRVIAATAFSVAP